MSNYYEVNWKDNLWERCIDLGIIEAKNKAEAQEKAKTILKGMNNTSLYKQRGEFEIAEVS